MTCITEECGKDGVVGLGNPPAWYCLEHFDGQLADIAACIANAARLTAITLDVPDE